MIEARKSWLFGKIFKLYNRNLIRRRFNALRVSGLRNLHKSKTLPYLIYSNHSSWWDGLIAFEISLHTDLDWFVMMEEKQLKKYFFFRWLGAFSIVKQNPSEALKSIQYVIDLMKENSNRAILIFPQGRIEPNDLRPIKFESGIVRIIQKVENLVLVPMAFRYEFLYDYKPEVFARIGEPKVFKKNSSEDRSILKKQLQAQLTKLIDDLRSDIVFNRTEAYEKLL